MLKNCWKGDIDAALAQEMEKVSGTCCRNALTCSKKNHCLTPTRNLRCLGKDWVAPTIRQSLRPLRYRYTSQRDRQDHGSPYDHTQGLYGHVENQSLAKSRKIARQRTARLGLCRTAGLWLHHQWRSPRAHEWTGRQTRNLFTPSCCIFDEKTNEPYNRLDGLSDKGKLLIFNSLLSEFAVLGFEYGYSWHRQTTWWFGKRSLVIFTMEHRPLLTNLFQLQKVKKWQRMSGLVMLLPTAWKARDRNTPVPDWKDFLCWAQISTSLPMLLRPPTTFTCWETVGHAVPWNRWYTCPKVVAQTSQMCEQHQKILNLKMVSNCDRRHHCEKK